MMPDPSSAGNKPPRSLPAQRRAGRLRGAMGRQAGKLLLTAVCVVAAFFLLRVTLPRPLARLYAQLAYDSDGKRKYISAPAETDKGAAQNQNLSEGSRKLIIGEETSTGGGPFEGIWTGFLRIDGSGEELAGLLPGSPLQDIRLEIREDGGLLFLNGVDYDLSLQHGGRRVIAEGQLSDTERLSFVLNYKETRDNAGTMSFLSGKGRYQFGDEARTLRLQLVTETSGAGDEGRHEGASGVSGAGGS